NPRSLRADSSATNSSKGSLACTACARVSRSSKSPSWSTTGKPGSGRRRAPTRLHLFQQRASLVRRRRTPAGGGPLTVEPRRGVTSATGGMRRGPGGRCSNADRRKAAEDGVGEAGAEPTVDWAAAEEQPVEDRPDHHFVHETHVRVGM